MAASLASAAANCWKLSKFISSAECNENAKLAHFETREDKRVSIPVPITIIRTGRPGRPRKVPNFAYVREAMSPKRNITVTVTYKAPRGCILTLLRGHMANYKIDRRGFLSCLTADLDIPGKALQKTKPSGDQVFDTYSAGI